MLSRYQRVCTAVTAALLLALAIPLSASAAHRAASPRKGDGSHRRSSLVLVGTVSAVDANAGTLTLGVSAAHGPGDRGFSGLTVTFSVSAATKVRVGDRSAKLADVHVGDRAAVAVAANSPADGSTLPALCVVVVRKPPSPPPGGGNGGGGGSRDSVWIFAGNVKSVDATGGTLVVTVAESPRDPAAVGTDQAFSVSAATKVRFGDAQGGSLAGVQTGDRVVVAIAAPSTAPAPGSTLAAVGLYDLGSKPSPPSPPPPPPPPPHVPMWAFDGSVVSVDPTGGNVVVAVDEVFGAPSAYVGQQQTFAVPAGALVKLRGQGTVSLSAVKVGDRVGIYVVAPDPAPTVGASLTAVALADWAGTSPPTA